MTHIRVALNGLPWGEALRRARELRGMTLTEVADIAGVTPGLLSRIENGHRENPTLHTVRGVCEALDLECVVNGDGYLFTLNLVDTTGAAA